MIDMSNPQPARPYVGAHLLVIQNNKVLLMKRSKGQMKGYYALIAGRVDDFEVPSIAMIREAEEEAGIKINSDDLSFLSVLYRPKADYKGGQNDIAEFVFYTNQWTGNITNMEPDLCDEIDFFDVDDLPNMVTETVKTVLNCWKTKQPYFEFEKRD